MGKETQFISVIKQYEGVIFKITTIYTDNKNDQQDLYQDIVYQLWKSFDSFRNEAKISTWMYRIALNTALTRIRKKGRQGISISIDKVVLEHTEAYDSQFEERLKLLYKQIGALNALDKGLILLFLEGKKYEEIAEITGLSLSNVGTRLARIKQKLKSQIVKN
ncbi:MAG: sigma-70 family RNA polymerase sigma factor [Maribacter sp.]|nr:sigma-70 family RNA polymerase sigma factor [Maribacter sp.]